MFQSARQIIGFPKVILGNFSYSLKWFQSARQIIGFPKPGCASCRPCTLKFQSARQIIGFPKPARPRPPRRTRPVSICKADYWLPQVPLLRSRAPRPQQFQSARQIIGFPKGLDRNRRGRDSSHVSICKADYWLPQVAMHAPGWLCRRPFQSARQIIGFPKVAFAVSASVDALFQSARQIIGFPKVVEFAHANDGGASFNLQGRLLASPRSLSCCRDLLSFVSICKADYWLPQAYTNQLGTIYLNKFQSARQIIGFPKAVASSWRFSSVGWFQSARQIIGFPKFTADDVLQWPERFQSARQIIGFPKGSTIAR